MNEIQNLRKEMEEVKSKINAAPEAAAVEEEDMSVDNENTTQNNWSDVLPVHHHEPTHDDAIVFCKRLATPPPLDLLKNSKTDLTMYSNIPQAPPPRRNRLDQQLQQAQQKAENAMHLMVHTMETDDLVHLNQASAWIRSLWQDLQETRRHLLVGNNHNTLEPRPDLTTSRLLTREEEQKVRQKQFTSNHRGRGRPQSRPAVQNTRPRSRSNFRGKGKGKGKGNKGQNTQE